jgi:hypothetical protein
MSRGIGSPSRHCRATSWAHNALCRGRIFCQCRRWAPRANEQFSTTVWAAPLQICRGAGSTERALKRANQCVGGLWGQITVTAFAIGSELQHPDFSVDRSPRATFKHDILTVIGVVRWRRFAFGVADQSATMRMNPKGCFGVGRMTERNHTAVHVRTVSAGARHMHLLINAHVRAPSSVNFSIASLHLPIIVLISTP